MLKDSRDRSLRVSYLDHGIQDGVPGAAIFQNGIGKHASVPADVLDASALGILEPIAGTSSDVQLAVWIVCSTVLAGLVMGSGSMNLPIVLSHVKVDGPGS